MNHGDQTSEIDSKIKFSVMKALREKKKRQNLTIHFSAFLPSLGMLYITAKEINTTSYTLKHTQK